MHLENHLFVEVNAIPIPRKNGGVPRRGLLCILSGPLELFAADFVAVLVLDLFRLVAILIPECPKAILLTVLVMTLLHLLAVFMPLRMKSI